MFWILLVIMGVVAAWLIIIPAFKAKPVVDESRQALNANIFQQRIAELAEDHEAARIDAETHEELKIELERNFLADMGRLEQEANQKSPQGRWFLLSLVLLIPLVGLLIYRNNGYNPEVSHWSQTRGNVAPYLEKMRQGILKPEELNHIPMSDFVYSLQREAQHVGDEAQLWFILGQTYIQFQPENPNDQARLFESGLKALRRAYYLEPKNTDYALSYVQALITQSEGALDIESRKILNELLRDNPNLPSAIMMYAMASYQMGDYKTAIAGWQKLLELGGPQTNHSQARAILERSIAQARVKMQQTTPDESVNKTQDGGARVTVQVALDKNSGIDVSRGFLMVYAQAEEGPPMPLAIKKLALPQSFPSKISLTDADAMMAQMTLSSFPKVKVSARISATGNAMKQPGDWYGVVSGIDPNSADQTYQVVISKQVN
ncbi:MAG: c-type cytochrome biogenesis protein CcmI [Pseudomonadales bacterium]|nr:c-type cytochrome biogenesis protein CcmI [Pseudomonadales bacterium]